ncbi:MAG: hypothetical protein ABIH34_02835, partial [Nanoarchaeota archaeon]
FVLELTRGKSEPELQFIFSRIDQRTIQLGDFDRFSSAYDADYSPADEVDPEIREIFDEAQALVPDLETRAVAHMTAHGSTKGRRIPNSFGPLANMVYGLVGEDKDGISKDQLSFRTPWQDYMSFVNDHREA